LSICTNFEILKISRKVIEQLDTELATDRDVKFV